METVKDIDTALADKAIAQVRTWLEEARHEKTDAAGRNLAGVLSDPKGLEFATGFVDGVVRPEDLRVAARNFRAVARDVPAFLPAYLRALIRLGGSVATIAPAIVVPIARRVLRQMVRHLIVDASDRRLGPALARIGGPGTRLNVNLLGEAILGQREADRRVAGTIRLIERPDVDYISIKVSSTVAPHSPSAPRSGRGRGRRGARARVPRGHGPRHVPEPRRGRVQGPRPHLDVFQQVLDRDEFQQVRAGHRPAGVSARLHRRDDAPAGVGRGARRIGRIPGEGAHRQGRNLPMEEVDADARLAPCDLAVEAAHRRRLRAGARVRRCTQSASATCTSASPGATSSTSPSRSCSPSIAASPRGSSSRCCSAWRPSRPPSCGAMWASCCCTRPSCASSTWRSRS